MTEWDHGHDGPEHDPGAEPDWDTPGSEPAAHLDDPGLDDPGLDDPYGSSAEPGPDPHPPAATPDEPTGLPEEQPVDWSGGQHPGDSAGWDQEHTGDPAAWDQPNGGYFHDTLGEPDQGDDGTDPAGWTAAAGADPFPPTLDLDVQPGDGGPWVDPDLLGGSDSLGDPAGPADPPEALLPDLAAADGNPDADWSALADSDDPAVRALTQHWS
jgi:hypothetical protein